MSFIGGILDDLKKLDRNQLLFIRANVEKMIMSMEMIDPQTKEDLELYIGSESRHFYSVSELKQFEVNTLSKKTIKQTMISLGFRKSVVKVNKKSTYGWEKFVEMPND